MAELPPSLPKPRKRRLWVRIALLALAALLMVGVSLGTWYAFARLADRKAIRQLEANVKARGEPLTLEELADLYPPIPDDQNAALVLIECWKSEEPELWNTFLSGKRPLPERLPKQYDPDLPILGKARRSRQRLTAEQRLACEDFLESRTNHLEATRQAFRRPQARFPIQVTQGFAALLPHLSAMKAEGQMYRIVALNTADRGNRAEAIAACGDIMRLSDFLKSEPFSISQLVRASIIQLAFDSAEDLVSGRQLTVGELRSLEALFEKIDGRPTLRTALLGDRAIALSIFDGTKLAAAVRLDPAEENAAESANKVQLGSRLLANVGFTLRDQRLILETFEKTLAASEGDWATAIPRIRDIQDAAMSRIDQFPPMIFASLTLPISAKMADRFASLDARKQAALVAFAIERYRSTHSSQLPATLTELTPELLKSVPKDPFDGQALRYHTLTNGYVVYSIGPNLRDDGGDSTRSRPGDVCFTVGLTGTNRDSTIPTRRGQ